MSQNPSSFLSEVSSIKIIIDSINNQSVSRIWETIGSHRKPEIPTSFPEQFHVRLKGYLKGLV